MFQALIHVSVARMYREFGLVCFSQDHLFNHLVMSVAPDIAAALKIISIVEKEQISGILLF
jgi:hypothetical protein